MFAVGAVWIKRGDNAADRGNHVGPHAGAIRHAQARHKAFERGNRTNVTIPNGGHRLHRPMHRDDVLVRGIPVVVPKVLHPGGVIHHRAHFFEGRVRLNAPQKSPQTREPVCHRQHVAAWRDTTHLVSNRLGPHTTLTQRPTQPQANKQRTGQT